MAVRNSTDTDTVRDASDWLERETTGRALAGDPRAGQEALAMCASALMAGVLSPRMAWYLAARLDDVLAGIEPRRALCIGRDGGRPRDPFPEWKRQLAALDALLTLDGVRPEDRNQAMATARRELHPTLRGELDRTDAQRIRRQYAPMRRNCSRETLLHLAGEAGKEPARFLPQTMRG